MMSSEHAYPLTPTHADLAAPVVALLHELRPDLGLAVLASLAVQALDEGADAVLDVEWAHQRQRAYPAALAAAHRRHTGWRARPPQAPPGSLEDIGAEHMARRRLELVR
jgi:hypothetical protein